MNTQADMSENDFIDDTCNVRSWSIEEARRIVELCEGNPYTLAMIYRECQTFNEAILWFNEPPSGGNGTRGYSEASGVWN